MKVDELSENDLTEIQKWYRYFDRYNLGGIRTADLGTALRCMKLIPSEAEVAEYINIFDPQKTGVITFEMFQAIAADQWYPTPQYLENRLFEAFLVFDKFIKGFVSIDLFRQIFTEFGSEPIPSKDVENLVQNYADFAHNRVEYSSVIRRLME
ncbi:unnamed protein product [Calicophoron daubneyi]|uniref:EF-hand domain-containing protein n=1 Tax=Calicophoron daubneyi TaxID=300641 RepID=A0AAV2TPN2_CALDB